MLLLLYILSRIYENIFEVWNRTEVQVFLSAENPTAYSQIGGIQGI